MDASGVNNVADAGSSVRAPCASLAGHRGPVLSVRFTRDGQYCLSTGKDRSVRLWNPYKQIHIMDYNGHGYEVRDVTIDADNSKFVSCGGDRQIFLWDVTTSRVIRKFRGHTSEVNSVCYSDNCNIFISGGYDQTVRAWDCRSRSVDPIQVMKVCKDSVMSVRCLENGDLLAGSVDGTIRRFDVRSGSVVTDLLHHAVTSVESSKDGRYTLASCMGGCVRLLDMKSGQLLGSYRGHIHSYSKIEAGFSPDESMIIGSSEDGKIYLWDLVQGNIVEKFQGHAAAVTSLSITETMLATSSVDGLINIWDLSKSDCSRQTNKFI